MKELREIEKILAKIVQFRAGKSEEFAGSKTIYIQ
jgi:hypothetical protein